MASAPDQPALDLEQEVRLAVVLYGGVSLAIYMYGVAQELFNLVWSTAPSRSYADDDEPPRDLAREATESTDAVYRALGRLLPLDGRPDAAAGPVRTRFVVDIISGTSAGGINGICLAKALAGEAGLEALKDVWLTEGDIGVLINDDKGPRYREQYREEAPSSLLSGRRMLDRLIEAITGMKRTHDGRSRLVDELDLWVTATDLEGLPVPVKLANATANERRHANRYHFRYSVAEGRDDFAGEADGFIAYAARSTSAFPFAFAPVLLDDLRHLDHVPDQAWLRFYSAYATAPPPEFAQRAFSDGGILDNKPFSYATNTLLNRHASLPVDRKVLYVEPDPEGPDEDRKPPREHWNVIATSQAATLGLPRIEHIRQDVQTVLARNRTIERVRDVIREAGLAAAAAPEQDGPAYAVYRSLKIRGVVDYLASLVVRAAGFDPGSDEAFAVRYVVRAWKQSRHPAAQDDFLQRFDIPYRLRRLNFLLERVKEHRPDEAGEAEEVRKLLADARRELRRAEGALVAGDLAKELRGLGVGRKELTYVLEGRTDDEMLARAGEIAPPEALDAPAKVMETELGQAVAALKKAVAEALEAPATPLREALRQAHDVFAAYDLPLYLAQYGTPVGETNPVDIVRISPLEADGPDGAERKLGGMRLFHFGAFLDERWRRHDMVWGRLDGAECLIKSLLPDEPAKAADLIRDAHRRILEEYRRELDQEGDGDVFAWFRDCAVADHPAEEPTTQALNRGAVVVSHLVEGALPAKLGSRMRGVMEGLRSALIQRDDTPAVSAVTRQIQSHKAFRAAVAAWLLLVIAGVALVLLGDGWRLAGCVLLGAAGAFLAVAIAVRLTVGRIVRGLLGTARSAAYRMLFPERR